MLVKKAFFRSDFYIFLEEGIKKIGFSQKDQPEEVLAVEVWFSSNKHEKLDARYAKILNIDYLIKERAKF